MRESSGVRMDYYKISGISAASLWKCLTGKLHVRRLKGRSWGDLTVGFQYMKGAYKRDEGGVITRAWSCRTRGNDFKPKENR